MMQSFADESTARSLASDEATGVTGLAKKVPKPRLGKDLAENNIVMMRYKCLCKILTYLEENPDKIEHAWNMITSLSAAPSLSAEETPTSYLVGSSVRGSGMFNFSR